MATVKGFQVRAIITDVPVAYFFELVDKDIQRRVVLNCQRLVRSKRRVYFHFETVGAYGSYYTYYNNLDTAQPEAAAA